MIRRSYVVPRLVFLALLWAFFALAFDPLLKWSLQKAGSAALGARVEIGRLRTGLFPPRIELGGFAAADPGEPMRNLAEFSTARFALEGRPLLERKVVVHAADVIGLAWDTPRKRSGALPRAPKSRAAEKLREWAADSRKVSFDALGGATKETERRVTVKPEDLRSAKLAGDLEKRWPASADDWRKRAAAFDAEGKAKEIERLLAQAQSGDPLSRVAKATELLKRVHELQDGAAKVRAGIEADAAKARGDLEAVRKAKAGDLDALRERLRLPSLDPARLSAYLLGEQTANRLTKALRLLEAARSKMPARGASPKPTSHRGSTIEFPRERSWPAFWLREARLAGTADVGGPLPFSGEASDFSSNPPLVGRPARLSLAGSAGGRKAGLTAILDHARETPRDELRFEYAGLPVAATTAGDPSSFAVSIGPGTASLSGSIVLEGELLSGTLRLRESGITIAPAAKDSGGAARLTGAAFAGIRSIEAEIGLSGTLQEPRLGIRSNLGSALAQGLKASLGKEAAARLKDAQAQISSLVDGRVAGLQAQLDRDVSSSVQSLGADRLKELEAKIRRQLGSPVSLPKLFGR